MFGKIGKKLKQKSFPLLTGSGDRILHYERLFPGCKGDEDPVYSCGGAACHLCGYGGKCGTDCDEVAGVVSHINLINATTQDYLKILRKRSRYDLLRLIRRLKNRKASNSSLVHALLFRQHEGASSPHISCTFPKSSPPASLPGRLTALQNSPSATRVSTFQAEKNKAGKILNHRRVHSPMLASLQTFL